MRCNVHHTVLWLALTTTHGKHGSSAPRKRIIRPTSWPPVASLTWSFTEQLARPATKRLHPSHWRPLEARRAVDHGHGGAVYATMMMTMMIILYWVKCTKVRISRLLIGTSTCLCALNKRMSCVQTAELFEMPFGGRLARAQGTLHSTRSSEPQKCTLPWEIWTGARHPSDNGHVQVSRPPNATNSAQHGRHAAAMRPIASIIVATCCY